MYILIYILIYMYRGELRFELRFRAAFRATISSYTSNNIFLDKITKMRAAFLKALHPYINKNF